MSQSKKSSESREVMPISGLLETLGFSNPSLRSAARQIIETAGYTNPRKTNISVNKAELVQIYIKTNFRLVCSDGCDAASGKKRMKSSLRVRTDKCEFCSGSNQNRLVAKMAKNLSDRGLSEILIVGGSIQSANTLNRLLKSSKINLKIVQGTKRINSKMAKLLCRNSDLVVIWGATQLDHTVSKVFNIAAEPGTKVPVARPGLKALTEAVNIHLRND